MKKIGWSLLIAVVPMLTACDKESVESVELALGANKTNVKVGEPVVFSIRSNSNNISLYTGDNGFEYENSAAYLLSGLTEEEIRNNIYRPADGEIRLYSVDLADSEIGAAQVKDNVMEIVNPGGGASLFGSNAAIVADAEDGQPVLRVSTDTKTSWSCAMKFNFDTKLGMNKRLTIRMKFSTQYLTSISDDATLSEEVIPFVVCIRLMGIPDGETTPVWSDQTIWTIQWTPSLTYTDYVVDLTSIIEAWEKAVGKKMEWISYANVLFIQNGSYAYKGDYYVKSATFGENGYLPFSTAHKVQVVNASGVTEFEYIYDTPGVYTATAVVQNNGGKIYTGDGYATDRADNIGADEYHFSRGIQSIKIHVSE